jgi:DNA-binding Lrp family transcriptional regulator
VIAYAQSAPGVKTKSSDTSQNAPTSSISMGRQARRETAKYAPNIPMLGVPNGELLLVDAIDRKILAQLQQDGRLTVTELAGRVQLSVSPCHRRVRALERSGAIAGYRAHLDAKALGLTFESLVFVTMTAADRSTLDAFEQAVAEIPNIFEAQRLFGDPDYLLRVIARDLPTFQQVYDDHLATLPGVQRLSSTLVMKTVTENRPLPLD